MTYKVKGHVSVSWNNRAHARGAELGVVDRHGRTLWRGGFNSSQVGYPEEGRSLYRGISARSGKHHRPS